MIEKISNKPDMVLVCVKNPKVRDPAAIVGLSIIFPKVATDSRLS